MLFTDEVQNENKVLSVSYEKMWHLLRYKIFLRGELIKSINNENNELVTILPLVYKNIMPML